MTLIVRGKAQVSDDGRVLGELGPGQFVGSALLLSGAVPEVDAVTTEPSRTVRWEVALLERYLNANPETRNLFQRHLSRDLAGKLRVWAPNSPKSRLTAYLRHEASCPLSRRKLVCTRRLADCVC